MRIRIFLVCVAITLTTAMFALHGCQPTPGGQTPCQQYANDLNDAELIATVVIALGNLPASDVAALQTADSVARSCYIDLCSDPNGGNILNDANCIMSFVNLAKHYKK